MPSSLPSSYVQSGAKAPQPRYVPSEPQKNAPAQSGGGGFGGLSILIAIIALGISVYSLYATYTADTSLSASQKEQIAGISNDLKALQNKDIALYAPVQTKLRLNKSYPIRDLFPATFNMPLEFALPIDTEVVGISSSGQPVRFKLQESVPIKTVISVNSSKAFANGSIKMDSDLPVNVELYTSVKIRSFYREELNSIIDRLDGLSGGTVAK
jgi:hypothetical protein